MYQSHHDAGLKTQPLPHSVNATTLRNYSNSAKAYSVPELNQFNYSSRFYRRLITSHVVSVSGGSSQARIGNFSLIIRALTFHATNVQCSGSGGHR
jgi:hypothetical protein